MSFHKNVVPSTASSVTGDHFLQLCIVQLKCRYMYLISGGLEEPDIDKLAENTSFDSLFSEKGILLTYSLHVI